ncbi:MAG: hypothetical protein Q8936_19310 [Bacillota bacterium]|nr:hypothetical protein [Bacillota bacterium]
MKIYNYDTNGIYIGCDDADESPLEPGVFLIPANATTVEPPELDSEHLAVWNGAAWGIQDISLAVPKPEENEIKEQDEPKTQAEILLERIELMQKAIDDLVLNGGI